MSTPTVDAIGGVSDTQLLGRLLASASDPVYILNEQHQFVFANEAAGRMLGYGPDEFPGMNLSELASEHAPTQPDLFRHKAYPGERQIFATLHRTRSGTALPVEVTLTAFEYDGRLYHSAFVRDLSVRERAAQAARVSEERFRLIADTSPVALVISEALSGRIHYANAQAARLFRTSIEAMQQLSFSDVLEQSHVDGGVLVMLASGDEIQNREVQLRHGDMLSWVSLSTSTLVLEGVNMQCNALMDVTEAHELSNQLSYQATYDDLTGLVNRREFEDRLQEVIELAQERGNDNALCYLDLDQFKVINDTCGHMAGDELLRQLAQELYKCVRRDDTLARLGGDEFAILLENCSLENAERVANNVRQMVQNFRFAWQDNIFIIGVSIGITPISQEGESISEVMRRADAACYVAKEAGRNRLHIFRFDDKELAMRHVEMKWVSRINAALDSDRFELWYQEIAKITRDHDPDGQTAEDHIEVLLRMRDPDGAVIMPGTFLPAAERYALATKIDRWVMRALFAWLEDNPTVRRRMGLCAVNLSGQTLSDENFHREVIAILENSSIPADRICFEITETSAIANLSNAIRFMERLKQHGCSFALDDFGSGLSSFAYLKSLPVDFVKIDGFFVKDILSDPVDRAMVKAIIDMAHAMGKKTIAEFVENDAILHELIDLNVDYVQGYGIARPTRLN